MTTDEETTRIIRQSRARIRAERAVLQETATLAKKIEASVEGIGTRPTRTIASRARVVQSAIENLLAVYDNPGEGK